MPPLLAFTDRYHGEARPQPLAPVALCGGGASSGDYVIYGSFLGDYFGITGWDDEFGTYIGDGFLHYNSSYGGGYDHSQDSGAAAYGTGAALQFCY